MFLERWKQSRFGIGIESTGSPGPELSSLTTREQSVFQLSNGINTFNVDSLEIFKVEIDAFEKTSVWLLS